VLLGLILLASPGCFEASRETVRLVKVPRPARPKLPKLRWTLVAKDDGVVFGVGQLKFPDEATRKSFGDLDGETTYLVDPAAYDEAWIRILAYVRALESAPVWETPAVKTARARR